MLQSFGYFLDIRILDNFPLFFQFRAVFRRVEWDLFSYLFDFYSLPFQQVTLDSIQYIIEHENNYIQLKLFKQYKIKWLGLGCQYSQETGPLTHLRSQAS